MCHFMAQGTKTRPVIVLLDSGDSDFGAIPVTLRSRHSTFDVEIYDWIAAGLHQPSAVRVDKIVVMAKSAIRHRLGQLSAKDAEAIDALVCRSFCP